MRGMSGGLGLLRVFRYLLARTICHLDKVCGSCGFSLRWL